MSVTEAERLRRWWRRSASVFLLLVATPAGASLLHLEGVLDSQAALPAAQRRLEFGSTYYGAANWTGLRHLVRLAGARGEQVQWSLTLPWLYSSYGNGGRSGRDNLHLGGTLRMVGGERPRLRLGGEFWVPLAGGELAPLGERRAFGRLALLGELAGGGLETGLSYTWELRGIGPETDGGPWPDAWTLDLRLGRRPAAGARACFLGGGTWQPEGDLGYAWLGAGLDLAWSEAWLVELAGAAYFGAGDDPTRADYRLRLGLRRDVKLAAAAPAAPADGASAGEAPPSGEPPVSAP
jgi:hypothetical protein